MRLLNAIALLGTIVLSLPVLSSTSTAMTPEEISRINSDRVWFETAKSQVARVDNTPEPAVYLGYDALRGEHRVRLVNGEVKRTKELLTNAGKARGDRVEFNRGAIDDKPRIPLRQIPDFVPGDEAGIRSYWTLTAKSFGDPIAPEDIAGVFEFTPFQEPIVLSSFPVDHAFNRFPQSPVALKINLNANWFNNVEEFGSQHFFTVYADRAFVVNLTVTGQLPAGMEFFLFVDGFAPVTGSTIPEPHSGFANSNLYGDYTALLPGETIVGTGSEFANTYQISIPSSIETFTIGLFTEDDYTSFDITGSHVNWSFSFQ